MQSLSIGLTLSEGGMPVWTSTSEVVPLVVASSSTTGGAWVAVSVLQSIASKLEGAVTLSKSQAISIEYLFCWSLFHRQLTAWSTLRHLELGASS